MSPVPTVLNVLLDSEEEARDQALLRFQDAQRKAADAEHVRRQLDDHRREYVERWAQQFRQQGTIELVQCYQTFMHKLDDALSQQTLVAQRADQHAEALRDAVQACEVRVACVQRLIERREKTALQSAEKMAQRHTDEAAQRAHARQQVERRQAAALDDSTWMN
jgi:flagellar protein FliJ